MPSLLLRTTFTYALECALIYAAGLIVISVPVCVVFHVCVAAVIGAIRHCSPGVSAHLPTVLTMVWVF